MTETASARRALMGALLVIGSLAFVQAATAASQLVDGLCFYAALDRGPAPSFCMGKPDVGLGAGFMGDGRVGGGVAVIGSASVSICALGNFNRPCGTVAFWHRPAWNPADPLKSHRMILTQSNFQITWYGPKRILFFMTGRTELGKGFKWDYSVATTAPRQWQAGQWHHVAITWDSGAGHKRIFLDGQLAAEGTTNWLRSDKVKLAETLMLGSATAQGAYDEWAVWDRVLSLDEIALLAKQPEAAAAALATAQPPTEDAASPVVFNLTPVAEPAQTVVEPGEAFHLQTQAHNNTDRPIGLALRLSVVDAFDAEHSQRQEHISLKAGEAKPLTFDASAQRLGAFKLRAEFDWQGETIRRDLGGFAVWPKRHCRPSADSFFGHHVNSWFHAAFIRQAQRLGLSWVRAHNMLQATWWPRVQPEPGAPRWTFADHVETYGQADISILGQFFGTPYWAADPPLPKPAKRSYPRGSKPRHDAFERYVRMVVERYGRQIHVWEVWNEPDCSIFWKGTAEEFGQLAETACRAAKQADPKCTVIVGGFTGAWSRDWYERAAKAGAFRLADGISFHGYARTAAEHRHKIDMFRGLAKTYAMRGESTVLWDSEWGVHDTTFYVDADMGGLPARRLLPSPSYLEGAARVVKADCLSMGLGVERSFYYLHNTVSGAGAYYNGSAIEITRAPRPKLMARVALEYLTRGGKAHALVERPAQQGLTALVLAKGQDASLAVVWLGDGQSALLRAAWPESVEVLDMFANPAPRQRSDRIAVSGVPICLRARVPAEGLAGLLREAQVAARQGSR